jgi:hypothetical protein
MAFGFIPHQSFETIKDCKFIILFLAIILKKIKTITIESAECTGVLRSQLFRTIANNAIVNNSN